MADELTLRIRASVTANWDARSSYRKIPKLRWAACESAQRRFMSVVGVVVFANIITMGIAVPAILLGLCACELHRLGMFR